MLPHVPSFLLLFSLFAVSLLGQSNTNNKGDYKLTVRVDLVGVLATVTTAEGALISGLKSTDLHVYENGQPQHIAVFAKEADQPLRLCQLFDSPASIASALKTQQDAAIEFLQSIFQFSDEVQQLHKFGNRLEPLNRAIRSIKPGVGLLSTMRCPWLQRVSQRSRGEE